MDADGADRWSSGPPEFASACERGDKALVCLLLAAGADVDKKDRLGSSPLHRACEQGHAEIVELLLRHGADVNLEGLNFSTPLDLAVHHCSNHNVEVVRLLLAYGADPLLPDVFHCTPLYRSAENNQVETLGMLLDCSGVDVNAREGAHDTTLLHLACRKNYFEMVQLLLDRGATDIPNAYGVTAVLQTATNPDPGAPELIRLLSDRGFDVNKTSPDGRSALWWACSCGYVRNVRALLAGGACVHKNKAAGMQELGHKNFYGTAEQMVRKYGHDDIKALFDSYLRPYYQQRLILDVAGKRSAANHPGSARHRIADDPHLSRYLVSFCVRCPCS